MLDKIAIVGVACRFPGAVADLDDLWELLADGREAVGAPPEGRFDLDRFRDSNQTRPGKSYTFDGGYLDDVAGFDADFFGISPREVLSIDPQQRLLLELSVEALDDAGIDPETLRGSDSAVFVGASVMDYAAQQMSTPEAIGPYTNSGSALSNTANRLSYHLDLRGPSLKVDTACASALNAVHLACEHLRHGGGRVAFAGGVNILFNPMTYIGFAKAGFLSPTGHCRPFSAHADGYVRAEGAGVLVLKRLADALTDGDRVHAVIEGSGTNSDGRTAGLVLPSAQAQESLLHEVYQRFALDPDELLYVEAHGTGTPIGDPAECRAIGNALGTRRSVGPLPIGSVKGNLGHLEPASGMAGLCKAILVLRHRLIPPTPHASPRNDDIDFDGLALAPVERLRPADAGTLVGVSSFGFGGTNVHVVLSGPAAEPSRIEEAGAKAVPVLVSGHTEKALAEALSRMDERLAGCTDFLDLAYTAWRRRGRHTYRRVVLAETAQQARRRLGEPGAAQRATTRGRVAFAFSGHGATWQGMAVDLLDADPVFTGVVAEVDAVLEPLVGWRVVDELQATESRLAETEVVQPVLFAVQIGIVEVLAGYGLRPQAVYGHSVGEIAAAYVAGVYDLAQAVELVVIRSRAQASTAGTGTMAAVNLPSDEAESLLARYRGRVEIAGLNSASDVTVAGPREDLRDLADRLGEREVFCRLLDLDYPFHSAAMDPLRPVVLAALADLAPKPATVEFVSTVSGGPLPDGSMDAWYWWRNIREPVRFAAATDHLVAAGYDMIVEIGPRPVLQTYLKRVAGDRTLAVLPTLTTADPGPKALRTAVEAALAAGASEECFFPRQGRVVDLPCYSWQREHHFAGSQYVWGNVTSAPDHVLLGDRAAVADPTWQSTVDPARWPWLSGHQAGGAAIMPAAGYLEMGWAAGRIALDAPAEVRELHITKPMVAPDDESLLPRMQVSLSDEDGVFRVATRNGENQQWQTHARGRVRRRVGTAPQPLDLAAMRSRFAQEGRHVDRAAHYADAQRLGLGYGPDFLVISGLWVDGMEVLADYDCNHLDLGAFHAHPAWTDAAPQAAVQLGRMMHGTVTADDSYMPVAIGSARLWGAPTSTGAVHFRCSALSGTSATADIVMTDDAGTILLELVDCRFLRVNLPSKRVVRRQSTELRAAPRGPAPTDIVTCALPAIIVGHDAGHDEYHRRRLAMIAEFTARTLHTLLDGAEVFFTEDLLAAGVRPEFIRLTTLLTRLAAEHGHLRWLGVFQDRTRWQLLSVGEPGFAELVAEHAEHSPELTLVGRCGLHLAELLRGERDALDLLDPIHGSDTLGHYRELSPTLRPYREAAAEAVRALVAAWPSDRPLRVLEVGGGTGALTSALLPLLPRDRARYVFTDPSPTAVASAAARFAAYDFVEYHELGLDQPGVEPGAVDLVVAGDALHRAKDVRAAVTAVAEALADHGRLLLVETHDPLALAVPFGLVPDFWSMTDLDLRPDSPLLSAVQWDDLLRDHGFAPPHLVAGDDTCSVVVACRESRTSAMPEVASTAHSGRLVVLAEDDTEAASADALVTRLTEHGADAVRAPADRDPFDEATTDVVMLLAEQAEDPRTAVAATTRRFESLRATALHAARRPAEAVTRLWLVGRPSGTNPAPEAATHPVDAALWGAARTIAAEHNTTTVRRISLDRGTPLDALVRELLDPTPEDEVVLTRSGRFVPRLLDLPPTAAEDPSTPYRLVVRNPGPTYRLAWVAAEIPAPGPDEVVVEVRTAGLNYRDPLIAIGMLPDWVMALGRAGTQLGGECAGVITAVGPEVTRFRPGDRVIGFVVGALASHVVANQHLISAVPPGLDLVSGGGAPVAFLTTQFGLRHLANLAEGETVLVHGASGGVGLAAVQVARVIGAKVIATAGTEEKRDFLRLLGVEHVFDSRSFSFTTDVLAATGGQGVDVVLNSLGGEFIGRSLELLRMGGRFVEIGKRDLYGDRNVSLHHFRNNISYFTLDIDQLGKHRIRSISAEYDRIMEQVREDGHWPLPHRVFPTTQVADAFKSIQHSRHIGKLVINHDRRPTVEEFTPPTATFAADGTYLVTGGASGLGAETARWLVDRGARHLVLVNRRGMNVPGARDLVGDLTALGVTATVHAADVTDESAMRDLVDTIDSGGFPLRGVVHAAMVLDDARTADLTADRFQAVLAPKMAGALVLDRVTDGRSLDLFLLHSSAAAVFGNAGQAAYCAGNLFLEALARARRARGQTGQAIAWGALGEVGVVARNEATARTVTRAGLGLLPSHEVRRALDDLVGVRGVADVAVVWSHDGEFVRRLYPHLTTPRLGDLVDGEPSGDDEHEDLTERLREASVEEAIELIAEIIVTTLAEVLAVASDRVDRNRPLDQLGVDSLMGAELIGKMRRRLGREVPLMRVVASSGIDDLARSLVTYFKTEGTR